AASQMPFRYTINAYRGCSHACAYCLSADTAVLFADGRTKPIADICVGDRVYGTQRGGTYRRYVPTDVLAHWETTKPAYRVVLEDRELVASADHRFLTRRGWQRVVDLGASDALIGARPARTVRQISPENRDICLTVRAVEALGIDIPMYDITTGTGDF